MKSFLFYIVCLLFIFIASNERAPNQDFNFNFDEAKHTQECQAKCQDTMRECFKKCRKEFSEDKDQKWTCQEECTNVKKECEDNCIKETENLAQTIKQMTKKTCEDQMLKCVQDCSQQSNIQECFPKCKKVKDLCEEKEQKKKKKSDL